MWQPTQPFIFAEMALRLEILPVLKPGTKQKHL
jgi:hypothetical protein